MSAREVAGKAMKPWIVMPVIAVLAVGVWWFGFRASKSSAASGSVRTITSTVTEGEMARTVAATGTVAAAQTDALDFTSGGTVTAVNVHAGEVVKKGQVLASIDPTDLQAAVASAQSDLAAAQAQQSNDSSSGATDAQISADAASVTSAEQRLASANEDLQGANLVATFDGTVSVVNLTVGEVLGTSGTGGTTMTGSGTGSGQNASTLGQASSGFGQSSSASQSSNSTSSPQLEVISAGRYTVTIDVTASDVANLKVGQSASIEVSSSSSSNAGSRFRDFGGFGGGGGFGAGGNATSGGATTTTLPGAVDGTAVTGTVTSVGAVADASSGVATYPVEIAFDGPASNYQPGVNVLATITYDHIANAVQVPSRAVQTTDSGSTVTVVSGTRQRTVPVEVGVTWNGMTQITGGLKAGQTVLLASFAPPTAGSNRDTRGGANGSFGGGEFRLNNGSGNGGRQSSRGDGGNS